MRGLADDKFYIVTGTGFRTHDFAWIRDHIGKDLDVETHRRNRGLRHPVADGAEGRDVLAAVTNADVSNAAFPFGHVREIEIAGTTVRALRITYVGELGWELHVPIAATGEVFDALMLAGNEFGIRPVGYRALESLRLEKGYRAWGSDITPNDSPFEAGLGWAVKLRKDTEFVGRQASEAIHAAPLKKRLAGSQSWIRRSCCSAVKPSCAMASRSDISPAAAMATRSIGTSAGLCAQRRWCQRCFPEFGRV